MIVTAYQASVTNATWSGWPSGWTEFIDQGNSATPTMSFGAAYKWSDGTEVNVQTVTQATTITGHADMILMSIPGVHPTTPPEATAISASTAAAATPNTLDPAGWGAEDTLWIALAGSGETSTTGSFTGLAATPPTNFSDFFQTGISSDVVGGVDSAVAFRQLNQSSLTVGAFAPDLSNARNAILAIAVRPAPIPVMPFTVKTQNWNWL
jgi:hypothetical protein